MTAPLAAADRDALRRQHTCIMSASSMRCRACDRSVPYPALTLEEISEALGRGREEAEAAVPALFGRPGRSR